MKKLQDMVLLYAEDELITQMLYKQQFANHFKTIYTANDGQQALGLYYKIKPDVVILDINMPLIDGLQVCKKIRENDHYTKIILLTSRVDKQTLLDAVELGLTSYLDKPATKERIIEALNKLLDYHKSGDTLVWREGSQEYRWYCSKRELFVEQEGIHLTKNEKALLELLITTKHKNLNYQQISDALYSPETDKVLSDAAIKTLMCGLRSKLPENTIKNEYGLGYFFDREVIKN